MKKITIYLLPILVGIAFASCKKNPPEQPPGPTPIVVTGVSVQPATLILEVGATSEPLVATVEPDDADNKRVIFSSDASNVAIVDSAMGVITAIAEGDATITVTTEEGEFTAFCEVTVVPVSTLVPVAGVSLPEAFELEVNETRVLEPVFDPQDASNKGVTWDTTSPETVSVSADGKVKALKPGGPVKITVTTDEGEFTAECSITVKAPTEVGSGTVGNMNWRLMSSGESN